MSLRTRLRAVDDALQRSFFVVPLLAVVAAVALAEILVRIEPAGSADWPLVGEPTVDSARAVLTTVASATVAFAGVAFSVSLLILQLGSSQYSPRVLHGLLRDPFNRRVIALVVGTFTFCLVVLRDVHGAGPGERDELPTVPSVAVAAGVVLGIAAVLGVVAGINHSARSMDVSAILERITVASAATADTVHSSVDERRAASDDALDEPVPADALEVHAEQPGWVRTLDRDALLLGPPGTTVRLETAVGRYVVRGSVLARVWPRPEDTADVVRCIRGAVGTGETRTTQQDLSYGARQLADVGLRALSPGVNDPTTAQDVVFRLADVVVTVLSRPLPPRVEGDDDGRRALHPEAVRAEDVVDVAFSELRRHAARDATTTLYLLEALATAADALGRSPFPQHAELLVREADLLLAGASRAGMLPDDLSRVSRAHASRFGAARDRAGTSSL